MATKANDILKAVSFALIERYVSTTLGTAVGAPGPTTVTPGSMRGIYVGAQLIVDSGGSEEVITVTSTTSTTFTATFVNAHLSTAALVGATFNSGQTSHPLWTQAEMLNYLAEAQNDFLVATRPVYSTAAQAVTAGSRVYTKPATAIRIEHITLDLVALRYANQAELDLANRNWATDNGVPRSWFEDRLSPDKYGFGKLPQVNGSAELWFSARGPVTVALNALLTVPDVMVHVLTYGVLARAWSKDGEGQDPMRAKYCVKRFGFIVALTQRLVGDLQLVGQAQMNKFPTFAVQQGA